MRGCLPLAHTSVLAQYLRLVSPPDYNQAYSHLIFAAPSSPQLIKESAARLTSQEIITSFYHIRSAVAFYNVGLCRSLKSPSPSPSPSYLHSPSPHTIDQVSTISLLSFSSSLSPTSPTPTFSRNGRHRRQRQQQQQQQRR